MREEKKKTAHPLYTSVLLLLMAVAAVTAVTIAWFSIADSAKVKNMGLDVTTGVALRFDLDAHKTFEEYVKTLSFEQISRRIEKEQGFSMKQTPLEPVTSSNFSDFTVEDGSKVLSKTGAYLEFKLNFMSSRDMVVHLTSANSANGKDKTSVTSSTAALPKAMRISFTTDGKTVIYSPGMGDSSRTYNKAKIFGLPSRMVYSDKNALFSLKKGVNKKVLIHIWLEGTDPACTDELKGTDYSISMRFEGTDAQNRLFDEAKKSE